LRFHGPRKGSQNASLAGADGIHDPEEASSNHAGFRALDDSVEVNGKTLCSIIEELDDSKDMVLDILAKRGLADPQPGNGIS